MAYIQLSLLDIPAIVMQGNSLAMTTWSHWLTPAHLVDGWECRLDGRVACKTASVAQPATQDGVPADPEIIIDDAIEAPAAAHPSMDSASN